MNRTRRAPLLVLALAAGTGATMVLAAPAAAAPTLRFTTVAQQNTDLDLGTPGPGAGDVQVTLDDVQRDGHSVGFSTGQCTIAVFTESRLVGACTTTLVLRDGSLTAQGAFEENPQEGPDGFRWAVTGGTGRYRGASGELTGTFREENSPDGADLVDIEIRLR
jgi:hypothetical protein